MRSKLKRLHDKAWKLKSELVRRLAKGICFTCGDRKWDGELGENNWKVMQAGHYKHGVLDFDPMNIQCQCVRCNKWLHGNATEYSIRLIKKYGLREFKKLHTRASKALKGEKRSELDYEKLISDLKEELKKL